MSKEKTVFDKMLEVTGTVVSKLAWVMAYGAICSGAFFFWLAYVYLVFAGETLGIMIILAVCMVVSSVLYYSGYSFTKQKQIGYIAEMVLTLASVGVLTWAGYPLGAVFITVCYAGATLQRVLKLKKSRKSVA